MEAVAACTASDVQISSLDSIAKRLEYPTLLGTVQDDVQLHRDLSDNRDQFSRLKFNTCELEAKLGFLEALRKDNFCDISEVDLEDLRTQSARSELEIKKGSAEIHSLEAKIGKLCDGIVCDWKTLSLRYRSSVDTSDLRKKAASDRVVEAEMERVGRVPADILGRDSEDACKSILDAQLLAIHELTGTVQQLKDDVEQLRWQSDPLASSLDKNVQEIVIPEDVSAQLNLNSKYIEIVEHLGGIRVVSYEDRQLQVEFVPERVCLNIAISADEDVITGATLDPNNGIEIDDLVEWCASCQEPGLALLINEVRDRLGERGAE